MVWVVDGGVSKYNISNKFFVGLDGEGRRGNNLHKRTGAEKGRRPRTSVDVPTTLPVERVVEIPSITVEDTD